MTERRELRAVDIEWRDSSHENGWVREPRALADLSCYTRGWLVSESKESIVVSCHATSSRDGGPFDQCHSPMTIPRSAIVSIRRGAKGTPKTRP